MSAKGDRQSAIAIELEQVKAELAAVKEELRLTDGLLANSNRVLNAIPECPVHGACVPHAVDWIEKAKARATAPEWRPLSVLEGIPSEKHGCHHLAIRRETNRPELGMIEWRGPRGWVWVDDENGEIPSWATHCRFTDGEGVPIPWSKVGL